MLPELPLTFMLASVLRVRLLSFLIVCYNTVPPEISLLHVSTVPTVNYYVTIIIIVMYMQLQHVSCPCNYFRFC